MVEQLIGGAIKFMEENYSEHAELFSSLANSQAPHTLFIGCSDSRVMPGLITSTKPGELFVVRNIANIVPPYRVSDDFVATTAAIEYALYALGIKQIIVCGHSNCGGCAALFYEPKKLEKTPNVKKGIKLMEPIKGQILENCANDMAKREWLAERLNIVNSLRNLLTYPHIRDGYISGEIKIFGWHYIIETGEIFNYDPHNDHFALLNKDYDYEKISHQLFD